MQSFKLVTIDEAGQLKECESLIPSQLPGIQHALLVVDEKRLPAMVISKICERANFGRSLFERLVELGHRKQLLKCSVQNASINKFVSEQDVLWKSYQEWSKCDCNWFWKALSQRTYIWSVFFHKCQCSRRA